MRLHTGQTFITGRSYCDACNATLTALALVPIVSYLALRGRARCCGARLSPYPPISELLLGGLFVLAYLNLGLTLALPFFLISLSILLALVLYDISHKILPFSLLSVFMPASAMAGFFAARSPEEFQSTVLTALIMASFLALIHLLSSGKAMGLADAPLVFGLAVLAGPNALSGLIFSFWIGAVIGIVLLYRRPRGSRMGVEVPFAPYLAAGFLLAYFTKWNLLNFTAALL